MLNLIITGIVLASAGFGVGRIKSASKLAAISTELKAVETGAVTDVKALAAKIKAHL